jgi:hypothetical protein
MKQRYGIYSRKYETTIATFSLSEKRRHVYITLRIATKSHPTPISIPTLVFRSRFRWILIVTTIYLYLDPLTFPFATK